MSQSTSEAPVQLLSQHDKGTSKVFKSVQLPVLLVDERPIAQTGSILRYIHNLAFVNSKDHVATAQADAAFEAAQEMPMAQIYVAVNLMEELEAKETARAFRAALPQYMAHWAQSLGNKKFFHGKLLPSLWDTSVVHSCLGCMVSGCILQNMDPTSHQAEMTPDSGHAGQVPGYADFFIWSLLDTAKGFVPDPFKDQPGLKQWSGRVKGLPAVSNYLTSRPRVRDVSKWKL